MAEARLRIITTVSGGAEKQLTGMRQNLKGFNREQERSFTRTRMLARGASTAIGSLGRNLFSLRTAVVGIATSTAGMSILEMTIGAAGKINQSRKLLGLVLQDTQKVQAAEEKARELVREIPSLDFSSALDGMSKLALVGGKNVEQTGELVRMAKALEGLKPEQGFEGAKFALKELETGDTMSLRERFDIRLPTKKEAEKAAKKAKKTLQQYYLDELNDRINTTYKGGVTALLALQNESIGGQLAQLKTQFTSKFAEIGKSSADAAVPALRELNTELTKWLESDEFDTFIKDAGTGLKDAALGAIELAKQLPTIVRETKAFVNENKTLIKLVGGGLVANQLTGGALASGAGSAALSFGKRALLGSGKRGGMAGALGGLGAGGATPVYVVNMGEMGSGVGDAISSVAGKGGKGASMGALGRSLTMGGALSEGGLVGVASQFGAGTMAGMLAIPAAFIGAGMALKHSSELTVRNLRIADNLGKAGPRMKSVINAKGETKIVPVSQSEKVAGRVRDAWGGAKIDATNAATNNIRGLLDDAMLTRDAGKRASLLRGVKMAASGSMASASNKQGMDALLEEQLDAFGLDVGFSQGRAKFTPDKGLLASIRAAEASGDFQRSDALKAKVEQGAAMAAELNKIKIDKQEIHLHVANLGEGNRSAQAVAEAMKKALNEEIKKLE